MISAKGKTKGPTYSLLGRLKEPQKSHVVNEEELERIVAEDIVTLLNTRQWLSTFATKTQPSTVDYGIPDFSRLNLEAREDRQLFNRAITRQIKRYISYFSLTSAKVAIDRSSSSHGGVYLNLEGVLTGHSGAKAWRSEPVVYTLHIDPIGKSFYF